MNLDLSDANTQFDLNVPGRSVFFLLSAHPVVTVGLHSDRGYSCTLKSPLAVRVPLEAGFTLVLTPKVDVSAQGKIGVDFAWDPRIVLAFEHDPQNSLDIHTFASPPLTIKASASAQANAFIGLDAKVTAPGTDNRVGVEGWLGPSFSASTLTMHTGHA